MWLRAVTFTAAALLACLIFFGLTGSFIVDWLWFSEVGHPNVFWTVLGAKVWLFIAVFTATALILLANGIIASGLARASSRALAREFEPSHLSVRAATDLSELVRHLFRRPGAVAAVAILLALLVAWGEVGNWGVLMRFRHQVSASASDPISVKTSPFIFFRCRLLSPSRIGCFSRCCSARSWPERSIGATAT
jgi:uncharacterized membrane protein (UPF0182 family)